MSDAGFEAKMAKLHKALERQKEILDAMDPDDVWHAEPGSLQALTSMEHWYPVVSRLVPVPLTVKVPVPDRCNLLHLLDGEKPKRWEELMGQLMGAVRMLRTALPSMPAVFLRTSYTSGKHGWEHTCYVDTAEPEGVADHLRAIVEFSALIDQPVDCLWVREFIETVPVFHAFGAMPVTREYRFRVQDGHAVHVQPYWPEGALEGEAELGLLPDGWRAMLRESWRIGRGELNELKAMTEKVGRALGGDWSVDWLQTAGGQWLCTDLARGELSYWWDAKEEDFVVEDGQ